MIRVIGDTTSGYNLEQAKALGIEFIPQLIVFGEKTYRDDTEMDSAMFAKKLAESPELPKTAAPPPALYTPIYQDMQEKIDEDTEFSVVQSMIAYLLKNQMITNREAALLHTTAQAAYETMEPEERVRLIRTLFMTLERLS